MIPTVQYQNYYCTQKSISKDKMFIYGTFCTYSNSHEVRFFFFLIKKENLYTKRVEVWALCEREGCSEHDTVKIDGRRVCLQEKKRLRRRCHCISCRHFIFSALGGHVINRSQVMSPPYRLHSHFVYSIHSI